MTQTDYDYCLEQQAKKMNAAVEEYAEEMTEVELISILLENLPKLTKTEARRVIDYAERLYTDKHGKDKGYREVR